MAVLMVPLTLVAGDQVYESYSAGSGYASDEMAAGESYLGVDTRDITPDRVSVLKLKNESGVEVTMVDQDAAAGKAGIKEQDVILTVNGTKLESVEQLRRMIHETPPVDRANRLSGTHDALGIVQGQYAPYNHAVIR
jgi:C-terminal processing protease CtpA/Prc